MSEMRIDRAMDRIAELEPFEKRWRYLEANFPIQMLQFLQESAWGDLDDMTIGEATDFCIKAQADYNATAKPAKGE